MTLEHPAWEESTNKSLGDLAVAIVEEGVLRMCASNSLDEETQKSVKWSMEKGLSKHQASKIEEFHLMLRMEFIDLAARLGYALATVHPSLISNEEWLAAAISKAGLQAYELTTPFDPED